MHGCRFRRTTLPCSGGGAARGAPTGPSGSGRMSSPPVSDKRRATSIRLAILLALVAFSFYLGMYLLGGT